MKNQEIKTLKRADEYISSCYPELTLNDTDIKKVLIEVVKSNKLPQIVKILKDVFQTVSPHTSEFSIAKRIDETLNVIKSVLKSSEAFHIRTLIGLMNVTIGQGAGLTSDFDGVFYSYLSKAGRRKLWETEWQLPVFVTIALIEDIKVGINIFAPTQNELLTSETIKVATTFESPREDVEKYIASL